MSVSIASGAAGQARSVSALVVTLAAAQILAALATIAGRFGDLWWRLDILSNFTAQILAVQVVCMAWLFLLRRKFLAGAALPFLAINLLLVAPYVSGPRWPAEAAIGPSRMRVMSANIHYSNHRVDLLEAEVARVNPDVLVLIEPTEHWYGELAPIRKKYPHVIWQRDGSGAGIMIASRVAWQRASTTYVGSTYSPSIYATICPSPERGPLGCVDLLAVHPINPLGGERESRMRNVELATIGEFVAGHQPERFITLGDFNTTPWSVHFESLLKRTGQTDAAVGHGLVATWFSQNPLFGLQIDHILVGRDIRVMTEAVGNDIGSDHYPIFADLAF